MGRTKTILLAFLAFQNVFCTNIPDLNYPVVGKDSVTADPRSLQLEIEDDPYKPHYTMHKLINVGMYAIKHFFTVAKELDLWQYFTPQAFWHRLEIPEESFMDFIEIAEKYGFVGEAHTVITQDGYINVLHRVYKPGRHFGHKRNHVVLMSHGLEDSSDAWIINGKDKSPAFVAASAGFDVWVTNCRGNKYSQMHKHFDPRVHRQFWDYSFTEMSEYDLPAFIEYIREFLHMKPEEKLTYVGHSQGNAIMYRGIVRHPEFYKQNIKGIVSLSPATRITQVNKMFETLTPMPLWFEYGDIEERFGIFWVQWYARWYLVHSCALLPSLCMIFDAFSTTSSSQPLDYEALRTFFGHYPATSSLKSWKHWNQIYHSKQFQEYDYGSVMNQRIYGQSTAPIIDVSKVKEAGIPIVIYYAKSDTVVFPEDIHWLIGQLGGALRDTVELDGGHIQYFVRKDASYLKQFMRHISNFDEFEE